MYICLPNPIPYVTWSFFLRLQFKIDYSLLCIYLQLHCIRQLFLVSRCSCWFSKRLFIDSQSVQNEKRKKYTDNVGASFIQRLRYLDRVKRCVKWRDRLRSSTPKSPIFRRLLIKHLHNSTHNLEGGDTTPPYESPFQLKLWLKRDKSRARRKL